MKGKTLEKNPSYVIVNIYGLGYLVKIFLNNLFPATQYRIGILLYPSTHQSRNNRYCMIFLIRTSATCFAI
ncbi:MAG: hypothetical protein ACMUEM_06505 [Flavobacteriales bacterium AspAUS03]